MTKRSWIANRFAIRPSTILYKDTGFQGYEPQVQQTHQPKKSRAKGTLTRGQKRHNRKLSRVRRPGRACPGGGETLANCEGGLSQYQRGIVRSGNGRRMWITQSPRAVPQTAAANMSESYFA